MDNKQADLFIKGDKDSLKQREAVVKELADYKKKVSDILNPNTTAPAAKADKPSLNKSQIAAINKERQEALNKVQATSNAQLADLSDDHQAGLVDEQTFIEKRLQLTLDGLNKREALLKKYGKSETDDFINLERDKSKAEKDYRASQLALDLKNNKSATDKTVAGLDTQHSEGGLSDLSYIDKRHDALVAGIKRDQTTLKEANQEQSALYKATDVALEKEQSDYLDKRIAAIKKGFKDEFQTTEEALKGFDQQAAADYQTQLANNRKYFNDLRNQVEIDQASNKISPHEAQDRLDLIDINEIKAQLKAYQNAVASSKQLTHELIENRIEQLNNIIAYSNESEDEIAEHKRQIAELEKAQRKSDLQDTINTQNAKAENDIEQSNKAHQVKKRNLTDEEQVAKRANEVWLQAGKELVAGLFSIEQQKTQNKMTELDRQQAYEESTVGENEAAKAFIQKKYDDQRKQLQRQQDRANREQAIFNVIVSTAEAVAKTYSEFPFPLGTPLAIAQAALGAVQIGVIAATPMPQYWQGKGIDGITNDHYAGPAIAGDRYGRELWQHDGITELVDKPTLINVGRNDVIYPNYMTEQLLQGKSIVDRTNRQTSANRQANISREQYQTRQYARAMQLEGGTIKQLAKAIGEENKKLPFNHVSFDERGVTDFTVEQNQRTRNRNKKHSLG